MKSTHLIVSGQDIVVDVGKVMCEYVFVDNDTTRLTSPQNETKNDMTTKTTFTVAQYARELKMSEKIARRRMRANAAREKNKLAKPAAVKNVSRANLKYEYLDTEKNREMIFAIIANK